VNRNSVVSFADFAWVDVDPSGRTQSMIQQKLRAVASFPSRTPDYELSRSKQPWIAGKEARAKLIKCVATVTWIGS
jgi:hypothetical protein